MNKFFLRGLCALAGALFVAEGAFAHGGVSIEADMCLLKIDQYLMHFTGYQPQSSLGQEFCEDIPNTGKSIIVLDFVDPELRDMEAAIRIVETPSWKEAQAYRSGADAEQILSVPAKRYNGGSVTLEHDFSKAGYFVGIVSVDNDGKRIESLFPFSVGMGLGAFGGAKDGIDMALAFVLLAIAGAAFFFFRFYKKPIDSAKTAETGA